MTDKILEIKRLAWACRRGMLELDLILLPFLQNHYLSLSIDHQEAFKNLLECSDQDLYNYFIKQNQPKNKELQSIIVRIQSCTLSKSP